MGRADYLALGDWNATCYQCGRKRKASTLEKNWQGYYVCPEHNEPRQTQDFVRAIPDKQTVPWSQPDTPWVEVPHPHTIVYNNVIIGVGDGVTTQFQLGSGLNPTTVTDVRLNNIQFFTWSANSVGLITMLAGAPLPGFTVTASGSEFVP